MSVSKEDREAYEDGKKYASQSRNVLYDMFFLGPEESLWSIGRSDSEVAAFHKGRDGEQLDADKGESRNEPRPEESRDRSEPSSESSSDWGGSDDYSGSYSYTPGSSAPSAESSSSVSGSVVLGVIVGLLFAFGAIVRDMNNSQNRNAAYSAGDYTKPSSGTPPEQIVDRGVCPYEGCRYGEKWQAQQDVDVYTERPRTFGILTDSLQSAAVVRAGDWVTTETGDVLSRLHLGYVNLNGASRNGEADIANPSPTPQDREYIILYSYLGEGCWTAWLRGQYSRVCNATSIGKPQNEWWIQIRMADGTLAWTNAPKSFVSQEGLNSRLGEKILDPDLALPDKLAEVDTLIAGGADLNGYGGQYGTTPLEAAIRSKDIPLLKELISKGLSLHNHDTPVQNVSPSDALRLSSVGIGVQGGLACPAFVATQVALEPEGDLMLGFLLDSGIQLGCLVEPPMQAFLSFGIATDRYPTDRAIKVAGMLVRYGVSVRQRDSQGKTVFDLLEQPNVASHPHAAILREALTRLENEPLTLEEDNVNRRIDDQ